MLNLMRGFERRKLEAGKRNKVMNRVNNAMTPLK